jgi:methionyl aminopeptidase
MIAVKSGGELEKMRRAGRVVADALAAVRAAVRPGVTTAELDAIAEGVIRRAGATPSFKGYRQVTSVPPFPATICASVNEELVHGIPGRRVLHAGDIVSIDCGAVWEGYHGDAALTLPVGEIAPRTHRLLEVTRAALDAGIGAARGGARLGDVSHAIQTVIEAAGYGVVLGYGGHGVGRRLHEDPHIPNAGPAGRGPLLRPGMTLALEPMVTAGDSATVVRPDRWTVATADGGLCAHFEHSICVTASEAEVLTALSPEVDERSVARLPVAAGR